MLEIKQISYQVPGDAGEELDILNDVSLTVGDGQFVVVTGPNGGGKTTLARAIMGLVQPTGGSITWNGTDITHMPITDRARLGVSYGFQQPPGSRACGCGICWPWPPAARSSPGRRAAST